MAGHKRCESRQRDTQTTEKPSVVFSDALANEVMEVAKRHGVDGYVFIGFSSEGIALNSGGRNGLVADTMLELSDKLTELFESGDLDPEGVE